MTIEQKAKAYDEAISLIKDYNRDEEGFICVKPENIFPELKEIKESEDEKIRKALIDYFDDANKADENPLQSYGIHTDKAIAWLEKQGGQKSIWHNEDEEPKRGSLILLIMQSGTPIVAKIIEPNHTFNHGERWAYIDDLLEKQGEQNLANSAKTCKDEQKPVDKVEPKFHEGDWVVGDEGIFKITRYEDEYGYELTGTTRYVAHFISPDYVESNYHPWTISNVKDGDVLHSPSHRLVWIYKDNEHYHACINMNYVTENIAIDGLIKIPSDVCPATSVQRAILFSKMEGAGYEWNAKKLELKKIEDEEYNGEDYGIDSLFHAQRILEKTLGSVDGYQSDDGILEHKCAITAVKKLYEQKPAWSEVDKDFMYDTLSNLTELKDRYGEGYGNVGKCIDWLKSLKPQNHWKPTEEQVEALHDLNLTGNISYAGQGQVLIELYNDLEKLIE